jgi:hypothetical protein
LNSNFSHSFEIFLQKISKKKVFQKSFKEENSFLWKLIMTMMMKVKNLIKKERKKKNSFNSLLRKKVLPCNLRGRMMGYVWYSVSSCETIDISKT